MAEGTILVVEDPPGVRALLAGILAGQGYQVLTATNGIEALALLETNEVDLIIADIMMPGMDGYQFHAHVVENAEWVAIPFVFLTARVLGSDIRYGNELGVDDYLTKPVAGEDLLAVVRGKLRRSRQIGRTLGQAPLPRSMPAANSTTFLTLGQLRLELGQYRAWFNSRVGSVQRRISPAGTPGPIVATEYHQAVDSATNVARACPKVLRI